ARRKHGFASWATPFLLPNVYPSFPTSRPKSGRERGRRLPRGARSGETAQELGLANAPYAPSDFFGEMEARSADRDGVGRSRAAVLIVLSSRACIVVLNEQRRGVAMTGIRAFVLAAALTALSLGVTADAATTRSRPAECGTYSGRGCAPAARRV